MNTKPNPKKIAQGQQFTSLTKVLTTVAALLITIIGARYIAQDLIAPVLIALFFTVLMYPIFKWFRHKGFTSSLSLLLMILTFFISIIFLAIFFTWSFSLLSKSLGIYVDAFKTTLTQTAASVDMEMAAETVTKRLSPETVSAFLSSLLSGLSSFFYYFIFIPILSFMILLQIDSLPKTTARNLLRENPNLARFQKFAASIIVYVFGRFKVNLLTGIFFGIALMIIGVDYPFVWGLLTVILSFIPYLGIVIAGIPPVILALAEGGVPVVLLVIGALVVINLLTENVLDPYIQGRGNKISTAAIIISLIFWTWLLGFVGAILSTPLTVLLKNILADFPETRWIASLMEGNYSARSASNKSN